MESQSNTKPLWLRFVQSTFFTASVGTSLTCCVSTPAEVIKTRLQLQGELTNVANKIYKGPFHGLWVILKTEGLGGIFKGLVPGVWYQVAMNGTRLTIHQHIKEYVGAIPENNFFFARNLFASGLAGIIGATVGSPMYLVKVKRGFRSFLFHSFLAFFSRGISLGQTAVNFSCFVRSCRTSTWVHYNDRWFQGNPKK
eukprot:TRINITY_DN3693_c0_g2_i1.p1 TRINITY_DN3693_c0_g2~~TRINITY_DN3693_c0_g2_i1.p1  ORF type:complete len:197 (-),score=25.03 TRINITY_DN3693_c0_g2_i1:573-1163(-)